MSSLPIWADPACKNEHLFRDLSLTLLFIIYLPPSYLKGGTSMLKQHIMDVQNVTLTENGALTYASTKSDVLNVFTLGGAIDKKVSEINLPKLILNAYASDPRLTLKVIFYLADIRQGQGRRDFFRDSLLTLAQHDKRLTEKLLPYIPEFGRWDYLYWFIGTALEKQALQVFSEEIKLSQLENRSSLMYKWLASEGASSRETRRNARKTQEFLHMTARQYRKFLVQGRNGINESLVERQLSTKQWQDIRYERVPSIAMSRYIKTFFKQDPKRFIDYLERVSRGETKINASVLYPSSIVHQYATSCDSPEHKNALLQLWKALPDYVAKDVRPLAVVDNSGSMTGSPIEIAASLGIYLAERLTGPFKDCVVSFSRKAKLYDLSRFQTVFDKYDYILRNSIVENTNLQSVFLLLLSVAMDHNVPNDEMPNRIIIISDMEFDTATSSDYWEEDQNTTNLDAIRKLYEEAKYEFPQIVFWNVSARHEQFPTVCDDNNVALVSGYSPAILKSALSSKDSLTPYGVMLSTVNTERYAFVDQIFDQLAHV